MKKRLPILVVTIMVLFISIACSFSTSWLYPEPSVVDTVETEIEQVITEIPEPVLIEDPEAVETVLMDLYQKVSPGVVFIQTIDSTGGTQGSGFVYDNEGHIITNYHVVENATELEVDFPSGLKVHGEVIGIDLDSDIAIIEVNVDPEELHPLELGDSDALQVGQYVIAIGNPYGLTGTMTMGIVSAKGRTLESLRATMEGNYFSTGDLIQTDASINPGNSGGPLLNLNGEVIGINRAIRTSGTTDTGEPINTGIGFAISINILKRVIPNLIEFGSFDYPYVGITAREELTLLEIEELGLDTFTGAYVVQVAEGGPADLAGIRGGTQQTSIFGLYAGGDMIVGVDGMPVKVFGDFLSYLLKNKSPGDTITLTILRNNQEMDIEVTLDKRP